VTIAPVAKSGYSSGLVCKWPERAAGRGFESRPGLHTKTFICLFVAFYDKQNHILDS
jgi:hypothetical protein